MPANERGVGQPRWPWVSGTALSLLGLGVASYLTYEHYTGSKSLTCPGGGGIIDCAKVTESIYNRIDGIPVADLGLVFFGAMVILQSPWLWRRQEMTVRGARILWGLVGMGTAIKLIYDELYNLDAICLWCTAVHAITFTILVVTAFGTLATSPVSSDEE